MTVDVTVVPLLLLVVIVSALAWAVRPWELKGGSWLDRLRVGEAVNNYDFWLSLRGIGGRRRRDLRDELRANLWEATRRVGSKEAVRAIGSTRRMASSGVAEQTGPRWGMGLFSGIVAAQLVVVVQLLALTVWADAAQAAKVSRLVGDVTLLPGMRAQYHEVSGGGFSFGADLGPLALIAAVLVFLVVARPWRLVRRFVGEPAC